MKNIIVSIIILAAVIAGCKKEVNNPATDIKNSQNLEKLILDFKHKL